MLGLDYETAIPHGVLKAAGVGIVLRYVTPMGPAWPKSMSLLESLDLQYGGVEIGAIFESTADRMLVGATAGHEDAVTAMAGMDRCRLGDGDGLAFAADWDVQAVQIPALLDYLHAARDVLGARAVPICYGGLRAVTAADRAGFLIWQTNAWSQDAHGIVQWHPAAIARQTGQQRIVGGTVVDVNEVYSWPQGPTRGVAMPTIPASVAAAFPDVAAGFPPNTDYSTDTAIIYADAGARAAAARAQRGLDNDAQILASIKALGDQLGRVPAIDAHALAVDITTAVVAAMIDPANGLNITTASTGIANAVVTAMLPHLPAGGVDPIALGDAIARHFTVTP